MYAVIDDVLDIVETAKPKDKARMLNRVYKAYFPKTAEKDPASDEEVEKAIGEEDEEEDHDTGNPAWESNPSPEDDGKTLGDVRKPDEAYLGGEDSYDDEEEDWTMSSMERGVKGANARHYDDEEELEESTLREAYVEPDGSTMPLDDSEDQIDDQEEFDDEEEPQYTADDLEPGMIVNCGAYGDGIIVCSIHDENRFWGTDDIEDYKENGPNASGWYFDVNTIEDITGSVDGEDDDDWEDQAERREMDSTFGTFKDTLFDSDEDSEYWKEHGDEDAAKEEGYFNTDEEIEETIKAAKARARILEGETGWGDADVANEEYDDLGPVDDFEPPERALAGTRHPENIMDTLNDEVFEYIDDLKQGEEGISNRDIVDAIVKEFSDPEHPMERGMASDILEDYEAENNSANEEVTSGQIEDEYADLVIDGVPDETALERLSKKYKLTRHELEMMLGEDREEGFDSYEGPSEVDEYPEMSPEAAHEFDDYEAEMNEGKQRLPFDEAIEDEIGDVGDFEKPVGSAYRLEAMFSGGEREIWKFRAKDDLEALKITLFKISGTGRKEDWPRFKQEHADGDILNNIAMGEERGHYWIQLTNTTTGELTYISRTDEEEEESDALENFDESIPGPSDQHAGQPTQDPMGKPATPYDTTPADLGPGTATNPNENTNNNQPAAPGSPPQNDQTQQLLQNPEFADFFQAMSKINPNDLQNLTQALGQK
jgi:hypothetical protein